ncbi:unnamed protein product [Pleuronectes platessa]|uniref:Uncharacterized protein n=1 Tax=Pleuronectes platessa TaxID=8262 RepID=A0A9N7YWG5_PLEPL|nr:unnamed protein product [Pleuronectes platessa]
MQAIASDRVGDVGPLETRGVKILHWKVTRKSSSSPECDGRTPLRVSRTPTTTTTTTTPELMSRCHHQRQADSKYCEASIPGSRFKESTETLEALPPPEDSCRSSG